MHLRATSVRALGLVLARLRGHWQPTDAVGGAARTYSLVAPADGAEYVVLRDDEEIARSIDVDEALLYLVASAGFYVGETSVEHTFLHAGVVGWRGRAILLPGRENTGKTMLTAALVRAGATYLSDDFAPIDDRGHVHPYPRLLSFRRGQGLRARVASVESLGGIQETEALPVGLVVFAPYRGLARWRPRRVSPGRGVLELLTHCLSAQTRPPEALRRLGLVVSSAPVVRGARGDADLAVPAILRRLEQGLAAASSDS